MFGRTLSGRSIKKLKIKAKLTNARLKITKILSRVKQDAAIAIGASYLTLERILVVKQDAAIAIGARIIKMKGLV